MTKPRHFAKVPIAAAGMRWLGEVALRILIALSSFANKAGQCWPSLATIATVANVDRRHVPAGLAKLEKAGLIARSRPGAGKSTSYTIIYPKVSRPEVTAASPGEVTAQAPGVTSRRVRVSRPGVTDKAESVTSGGALREQESEQIREQKEEGLFEPDTPSDLTLAQLSWNALAGEVGLPRCDHLTDGRRSKLRARLKEAGGIQGWNLAIDKVRQAPWMHGANDRGWKANFDFLLKPDKFAQLMEGGYDQRQGRSSDTTSDAIAACDEMIEEAGHG